MREQTISAVVMGRLSCVPMSALCLLRRYVYSCTLMTYDRC